MSRSPRRIAAGPLTLALCLLGAGTAHADRLLLVGGGAIHADTWWIDGPRVVIERAGGTITISRELFLGVDERPGDGSTPSAVGEPKTRTAVTRTPPGVAAAERDGAADLFEARAAFEARDFQRASSLFLQTLQANPDVDEARLGYAISLMALGHHAQALGIVLDGLARRPNQPALSELLGDLRDREERVEDALRAWRVAFDAAPNDRLREKILRAERELHVGRGYALSTTPHFNLRYDTAVDEALSRSIARFLEQQYWVLADLFDHAPSQPITVLLYPTQEFRDVTQAPEWVGGLYDGKIRVPLGGLRELVGRAERVLTHELAHAVIHAKTRGDCPRWLHEGLAQLAEGRALSPAQRREVATRLSGAEPVDWEAGSFSYPLALSFVQFLEARRGRPALIAVLNLLGEGRGIERALRETYGEDSAGLMARWRTYASAEASR